MSGSRSPTAAKMRTVPAVGRVAGDRERALVERLAVVVQLRQVDVGDRSHALASRAHAAGDGEGRASRSCRAPFSTVIAPTAADRRDVEGEGVGRADVRLAEAAEQHAQHRVGVGRRADRRAGVGAHPLLVDDDRGRQPFQDVDLGPGQRRHESLHERAVGLVDQPLRLRRDGAEHQRRLARSRDAGEHRQPPLGDLDADVLQVVLPRALDADQVVAVGRPSFGNATAGRLAGGGHAPIMPSSVGGLILFFRRHDCCPSRSSHGVRLDPRVTGIAADVRRPASEAHIVDLARVGHSSIVDPQGARDCSGDRRSDRGSTMGLRHDVPSVSRSRVHFSDLRRCATLRRRRPSGRAADCDPRP